MPCFVDMRKANDQTDDYFRILSYDVDNSSRLSKGYI